MGMGVRVTNRKDPIVLILLKSLSVEDKSKWVAKDLIDV